MIPWIQIVVALIRAAPTALRIIERILERKDKTSEMQLYAALERYSIHGDHNATEADLKEILQGTIDAD